MSKKEHPRIVGVPSPIAAKPFHVVRCPHPVPKDRIPLEEFDDVRAMLMGAAGLSEREALRALGRDRYGKAQPWLCDAVIQVPVHNMIVNPMDNKKTAFVECPACGKQVHVRKYRMERPPRREVKAFLRSRGY